MPEDRELERGVLLALLTVGYAACAMVSILLFQFDDGQAGIWLPNVFAVAVLLRNPWLRPLSGAAAVFAGCLAANFMWGAALQNSLFFSVANALTVLCEATLMRKVVGDRKPLISGVRDLSLIHI